MLKKLSTTLFGAFLSRNPVVRHGSRHSLVSAIGRQLGIEVYNSNLSWTKDDEFLDVWRKFSATDGRIRDRKYVLYSIARSLAHLPGDTAECGVYDGGSSYLMCYARQHVSNRDHHVFDSFEGLSAPQSEDTPVDSRAYRWKAGDLSVAEETVARNLSEFDFIAMYRGWIPSRFSEVSGVLFSVVHIDVDLYQPTLDALQFFYERLVPGGMIVCDDYGFETCPGARKACDEFTSRHGLPAPVHITTGQALLVK